MQKLILPITIMAAFIIGANGCSSIDARTKCSQSGVYPGVKAGTKAFKRADGITENTRTIIDLPLSFALDTVLLPFDLLGVTSCKEVKVTNPDNNGTNPDNNGSLPGLPKS